MTAFDQDPRWRGSRSRFTADTARSESPQQATVRRILAAVDAYYIELEYEGGKE